MASGTDDGGVGAPEATTIIETLRLGDSPCSIQILDAPASVCAATLLQLSAQLDCFDDTQPVNDPTWLLDGNEIGKGLDIGLALEVGSHVIEVSCGGCSNQIVIESVDCSQQPQLRARHTVDETESTIGLAMRPVPAPVTPLSFPRYRYLMHPFDLSIDESVTSGVVTISSVEDDVVEVYEADGTAVPLPAEFAVADLPTEFLVAATSFGNGRLEARYDAPLPGADPLADEVKIRSRPLRGLTGKPLDEAPYFHFVNSFHDTGSLDVALDPGIHADRLGQDYDIYVVEHRSDLAWASDNSLTDVSGSVEAATLSGSTLEENRFTAWSTGLDPGSLVSKAYDVVFDFDGNGTLDPGDLIDGLYNHGEGSDAAGCYVVKDLASDGPYATTSADYSGGFWLTQRVYYPNDLANLDPLPLVAIGHGNGHSYTWFDYLGHHLASHGYVVMTFRNNTGPGIEAASTTTLTNMDYFWDNISTNANGVLDGNVDPSRVGWIGHSRGGEAVVRAYDRLYDGNWSPSGYAVEDVRAVASIAPTVYLLPSQTDPHDSNYYLIVGGADGDVTGRPDLEGDQYFRIPDRSQGASMTTYIHGATHNDFNCCGFDDGIGPNQIGRAEAQRLAKAYFLALMNHYLEDDPSTLEYFTRMYDDFGPQVAGPEVEIAATYRDVGTAGDFVIDDFQSQPGLDTSSSGESVSYTVAQMHEGIANDNNTSYTWTASDPMNGMTFHHGEGDFSQCLIFEHASGSDSFLEFAVAPAFRDVRGHRYLSFRACQGTRHPETVALDDDHSFSVTLSDETGETSTVAFGAWGNVTSPYPRTGSGSGAGWVNEMNTVRIPLAAFEANGSTLSLAQIAVIRFEFGAGFGSDRGRIGLDDVQFCLE